MPEDGVGEDVVRTDGAIVPVVGVGTGAASPACGSDGGKVA